MRIGGAVAVAAVVVLCGGAVGTAAASTTASRAQVAGTLPAHAPWSPPAEGELAPLKDGLEKLKTGDWAALYPLAKAYVGRPGFDALPEETRHLAWHLLGLGAWQTQRLDEAHAAFKTSTRLAGAVGWDWLYRSYVADADHDPHDAVYAFTKMLETDPRPMEDVADGYVDRMADLALDLPRGEQRQMYLIDDLLDRDWKPKEPSNDWSQPWTRHAARLLDRGDLERAGKAIARVTSPESLMAARVDRRFAPLLRKNPGRYDIAKALVARIEARRAEAAAKPRQLAAVNVLAMALLAAGRDAQALATTQAALARPADAWDDPRERAWTLDIQARALRDLGRTDQALAAWREAALVDQGDRGNVSQVLNLADALLELGHPAEALALLDRVPSDQISGYGRMVAADIAVCARAQLNDPPGLKRALAALDADREAAPLLAVGGLLCAGQTDAAAASLIDQLKDPETRLDALADVQDYPADPTATPFRREQLARRRTLHARPDVRAAIAAVGRVERQPHPTVY